MASMVWILLLVLFIIGVPVGFALIICTVPYFMTIGTIPMQVVIQRYVATTESISLLAIPFFISAGSIMNYAEITGKLMDLADLLVGHIPGGLGHVNILLSTMMGGLSGSACADAAQETKILVPEMVKKGYDKPFCAAVTAASSIITPIIPPSIGLVVYAFCTDTSVGRMLASGYLPGLLMCISMMIYVRVVAIKRKYPVQRDRIAPFKQICKKTLNSLWALGLPVLLIVGLRCGVFSADEGGAVCCAYSLLVGAFVYKTIKKEHIVPILKDAVLSSCTVMLIQCSAKIFGYFISWESLPSKLASALTQVVSGPSVFLLIMVFLFLIIGMFMDATAAMLIIVPIVAPVAKSLGIDMVHFGLVMVMTCAVGTITPPFGNCIYLIAPMMNMRVADFIKELLPFILIVVADIIICLFIPQMATWIPTLIYG